MKQGQRGFIQRARITRSKQIAGILGEDKLEAMLTHASNNGVDPYLGVEALRERAPTMDVPEYMAGIAAVGLDHTEPASTLPRAFYAPDHGKPEGFSMRSETSDAEQGISLRAVAGILERDKARRGAER